jgi:hypothetical protein
VTSLVSALGPVACRELWPSATQGPALLAALIHPPSRANRCSIPGRGGVRTGAQPPRHICCLYLVLRVIRSRRAGCQGADDARAAATLAVCRAVGLFIVVSANVGPVSCDTNVLVRPASWDANVLVRPFCRFLYATRKGEC